MTTLTNKVEIIKANKKAVLVKVEGVQVWLKQKYLNWDEELTTDGIKEVAKLIKKAKNATVKVYIPKVEEAFDATTIFKVIRETEKAVLLAVPAVKLKFGEEIIKEIWCPKSMITKKSFMNKKITEANTNGLYISTIN